ncbi:MAG: hypothetical protein WAV51_00240 [Microgenomates group bacterium]
MKKKLVTIITLSAFVLQMLGIPRAFLIERYPNIAEKYPETSLEEVSADYQYTSVSQSVDKGGEVVGNYLSTRIADNDYMRIMGTATGVEVTYTIDNVRLWNANRLIVMYDGSVSNAAMTYQVQIRDVANGTWRNIVPHEANYANTADAGAGLILAPATTGATAGGYIEIYDGYFSNGSNTPISTPLSNFVNNTNQVQIRMYSAASSANYEMRVDYIGVQATYSPMYYVSGRVNNDGGTITNEYNDTTHDDAMTNMSVVANANGIDVEMLFNGVSVPYTSANTYLVEFSGLRTTITNYSLYLRDFANNQWDLLNATPLTATTDDTYYFALVPSSLSQNMSDYIQNGQMKINITSAQTSGSVTVDYLRITIGSTATNVVPYAGTITRGSTNTNSVLSTRTVDTSQALNGWIISASNSDARTTTELYGDCATATSYCASANTSLPVTVPDASVVQSVITAYRFNTSSATLDTTWTVRNYAGAYTDIMVAPVTQSDVATNIMYIQELSNPMRPQIGEGPLTAIPTFTPNLYVDDITDNAVNIRFRTSVAEAVASSVTWDFAFATIKSITPQNKVMYKFTPTGGSFTYGTNNASNWRFAIGDDAQPWNTDPNATSGTDAVLSFSGVSIPTGANKMIVTSKHRFDVSNTYKMYIYDYVTSGWRDLVPHGSNFTGDATVANWDYAQFEIFDGFFSNGSNVKVSTPLTNFISSGAMQIRIVNTSTTADLDWDFAQIQFVTDPGYHPSSLAVTAPATLTANEYNDLYTDDNTSNVTVTPSGNAAEVLLTFSNIVKPPEGFNAILLETSAFKTTAGSYDVSVKNVKTNTFEPIVSGVTRTADATDYFLFSVGDWDNYIDSATNTIILRYYTSVNNNVLNLDLVQITLGTIPSSSTNMTSYAGAVMNGTVAAASNMNTYANTDELQPDQYVTVTTYNPTTGMHAMNGMGEKELEFVFPFHMEPNTVPAGIIYMFRGQNGNATQAIAPSIQEVGGHFRPMLTAQNFLYSMTTLAALPGPTDTPSTINVTAQTFRQGWYVDQLEDLWVSKNNKIIFRFYTAVGLASVIDTKLILDSVFFSYRWVNTKTTSDPASQMRHGKWWFGGFPWKFGY